MNELISKLKVRGRAAEKDGRIWPICKEKQ